MNENLPNNKKHTDHIFFIVLLPIIDAILLMFTRHLNLVELLGHTFYVVLMAVILIVVPIVWSVIGYSYFYFYKQKNLILKIYSIILLYVYLLLCLALFVFWRSYS
jgi:hypothetical protein